MEPANARSLTNLKTSLYKLEVFQIPVNWHADVSLKKHNSEATFTNLHPISNLPFASKLTERVGR